MVLLVVAAVSVGNELKSENKKLDEDDEFYIKYLNTCNLTFSKLYVQIFWYMGRSRGESS